MCNTEFVVVSSIMAFNQEEAAKKAEREAAVDAEQRALGAERLRRSQEDEKLEIWHDTEARKVNASLGQTEVAAAGAGVEIAVLTTQWSQASIELAGAARATRRRQAAAGNIREIEIEEIRAARVSAAEAAGSTEKWMKLASAFAQGIAMERKIWGDEWDGDVFGIKLPDWMLGMDSVEYTGSMSEAESRRRAKLDKEARGL